MTIFQAFAVVTAASAIFWFLILARKSFVQRAFTIAFFGLSIVFVILPDLTTRIAHAVGVGRGADLIFYLFILFISIVLFQFTLRFRRLQETQTELARALAIQAPLQRERAHTPQT